MQSPNPNPTPESSFEELVNAFTARIHEVQELILLRSSDGTNPNHQQELREIDARLHAVYRDIKKIRQHVTNERAALPGLRACLAQAKQENQLLRHMLENLPQHMPKNEFPTQFSDITNVENQIDFMNVLSQEQQQQMQFLSQQQVASQQLQGQGGSGQGGSGGKRQPPKVYVTVEEFDGVASYMKGRITRDKVNMAIDDLAEFAVDNQKLMQQIKSGTCRLSQQERQRAAELYHNVGVKNKHRYWFCETDLRKGSNIKMDKTGKSILTILRHLGRVSEQRLNILGQQNIIYFLE
eukprot:TRINITY_DN22820_c0_g2_i1.p2 TRINITY_DN22820_c0_g2~~TRINITY_DN22820_c0_g2_i1.p2  ORF type:complete len:295 (-),score=46.66 TRINITY_DN22820_c0_g2_i1:355-1239(-)